MNALMFEPLLRDATIKAIDTVADKFAGARVTSDNVITGLLNRWNAMTRAEKERTATVVVATAAAAVTAVAALKGGKKKLAKKVAKSAVKRVARRASR